MPTPRPFVLAVFVLGALVGCTRPSSTAPPEPAPPVDPAAQPCTESRDCGFERLCEAGACRPCNPGECTPCPGGGCHTDGDCEANHVCDAGSGCPTCVASEPATPPATPAPPAAPPTTAPPADPRALLLAMEAAYADVRDYTVTLVRRERVKGKLQAQETMQVKFRKPYATYIKWVGATHKGREALYVRGRNGNKLRAHQGSFPDVTVDLDPRGSLAMKGNRHPITEGSLGDLIGLLTRDLKRAETRPQDGAIIKDLGESERHGHKIRCIDATFAVADGYYAPRVQVCMFTATSLPSRVQVWDARDQLLEDYEYRDLKTNVGLRDLDFDSTNPKYNF